MNLQLQRDEKKDSQCIKISHYVDVIMGAIPSQITSLAIVYSFIQTQKKTNIKAPRHWPLWGEFTGDRWIPRTYGQLRGKCFHLMTSSWYAQEHGCHSYPCSVLKGWHFLIFFTIPMVVWYQPLGISMLKPMLVDTYFQSYHLIGWQHNCQPITSQLRKPFLTNIYFSMDFT